MRLGLATMIDTMKSSLATMTDTMKPSLATMTDTMKSSLSTMTDKKKLLDLLHRIPKTISNGMFICVVCNMLWKIGEMENLIPGNFFHLEEILFYREKEIVKKLLEIKLFFFEMWPICKWVLYKQGDCCCYCHAKQIEKIAQQYVCAHHQGLWFEKPSAYLMERGQTIEQYNKDIELAHAYWHYSTPYTALLINKNTSHVTPSIKSSKIQPAIFGCLLSVFGQIPT